MFSLVCALPSPASAEGLPPLFGWFTGTTAQSDFSSTCMFAWYLEDNIGDHTTDPKGVNWKESIPFTPGGMAGTVAGTGFIETNVKWSINGYIFGNMPLATMTKGDHVRWYVATLGDFNNAHTPHWHGNTVLVAGQRTDVLVVTSAQMMVADMVPDAPGIWLYHCHISDHMLAGMVARYEVKKR